MYFVVFDSIILIIGLFVFDHIGFRLSKFDYFLHKTVCLLLHSKHYTNQNYDTLRICVVTKWKKMTQQKWSGFSHF